MVRQIGLFPDVPIPRPAATDSYGVFRKLYFHMYSNSGATRAERILEDLGKLLLIAALGGEEEIDNLIRAVEAGEASANEVLLPALAKRFPRLVDEGERFSMGDDTVGAALKDLGDVDLRNAPAAVLGDAFQALIGPRLRGERGQFFTPRTLVRAMVEVAQPRPEDKVVDPAAGTGGFLVETHVYRERTYGHDRSSGRLVGIEKDPGLQRLGGAMVTVATGGRGEILSGNSLDTEAMRQGGTACVFDADIVLTNPPFGSKIGITDKSILQTFDLGHIWTFASSDGHWYRQDTTRKSQDPQILFIEVCLELLRPGGLLGIVLPEGIFGNRKTGYIWDFVRRHGTIEAMIDCPRTTFQPGTDTKTNVLFLRKSSGQANENGKVFISVAKQCGHDRRGRTQWPSGEAVRNDFYEIGQGYARKNSGWWVECYPQDPYYLVPRYHYGRRRCPAKEMVKKWGGETVQFQELARTGAVVVRKGNEVGAETYGTGDIPFIRTSDINNWEVSLNPTNGVSEDVYRKVKDRQGLRSRDILLVVDGRYKIGKTAILHEEDCRSVVQSHFRILTVTKKSPLDAFELLYILSSPEVLDEIRDLVFIQSTLGSVGKRLGELVLPVHLKHDEWRGLVKQFQEALELRAQMRRRLRMFNTTEIEL